jgi:hypothetical protein
MPQPTRSTIGDDLAALVPQFDALVRDAGLGTRSHRQYHDLEERAQRIASAIVAPFRGPEARPVNPPLSIERRADGSVKAGW